jgi:isoleucyl-tRNA synthetase
MSSKDSGRDWKDTIQLPRTDFSMRANLSDREPDFIAKWREDNLYQRAVEARDGKPKFVFHDGPPYANGDIHHGHALNKILKDFSVKYRWLKGYQAVNVPGWDCHGLPIEQKVDDQLGDEKKELSEVEFRQKCRDYASKHVDIQREQFRRLMVLAEWDRPYLTMHHSYEATIVRELGRHIEEGYVYKGLKPVHWSWGAVTSLAEAEVEYQEFKAPSVYVRFDFPEPPEWLAEAVGDRRLSVVIWTTTPWTLPANQAIALNPELNYEALGLEDGTAIIVASGLKEEVLEYCDLEDPEILASFEGAKLVGHGPEDATKFEARHPFRDRASVLLPAEYVTLEQGTGCVHTAPGHGQEDFMLGRRYDLEVLAPVDPYGKFTAEVPEYEGEHVFRANKQIAQQLFDSGHLLNQPDDVYVVERYPFCWRTKKPLIFRATSQWFIDVDHNDLREKALKAISETDWIPHWGEKRIQGMIESRPDWNISRQRSWGVPITAFECESCGAPILDHRVAYNVAELVEEQGADAWYTSEIDDIVPDDLDCPECGAGPDKFLKVRDILDVWFDSGVSWAAVLRDREGLDGVADLYLEGSDQHRGWFHTSLLTSVATTGHAPYKTVLTHGFVIDENGHKYSKSSKNFEPLDKMVDQYGAELIRLWVATVDYRGDVGLAKKLLKQVADSYRKIRNTIRFLLGNLSDFEPDASQLKVDELTPVDRWVLSETAELIEKADEGFENYEFHTVFHALLSFCNQTMSAVYLDVLKDRMYCDAPDSPKRRGSQAVLYEALRAIVGVAGPILSFTTEEVWEQMPHRNDDAEYLILDSFPEAPPEWSELDTGEFEKVLEVRDRVLSEIEARRPKKKGEREEGQIGSSQEAVVTLRGEEDDIAFLEGRENELAELFIVSEVQVVTGEPDGDSNISVGIELADADKCDRCWNFRESVGSHQDYPGLCARCADVVEHID